MIKALLHEVRMNGFYDGWGTCMAWLFALADYMADMGRDIPDEWRFIQSPMGSDTDSYEYQTLLEMYPSEDDCNRLGAILWRYRGLLIHTGKDY